MLVYSLVVGKYESAMVALCWACVGVCHSQQATSVPIVTVCEALRDLDGYRGGPVVVVGHSGLTFEGTFIDEPCEPDNLMLIHGQRWLSMMQLGIMQSAKYKDGEGAFPVDEALLWRKLNEVSGYTAPIGQGLSSGTSVTKTDRDLWGNWDAVYGRIESPVRLVQQRGRFGYSGNGYGANGTVPAIIRVIRIKTLVRGRGLASSPPPVPELPEPPAVSIEMPVLTIPQLFATPPPVPPAPHSPPSK